MSFRVSRDGTLSEAKAATTPSGIPFMYNTGDNTTLPSLDSAVPQYIQGTNSFGDHFGRDVAVGNGKIVTGAQRYNDPSGINTINTGIAFIHDLNGNLITSLTDGDSGDLYGTSVAIGSNKIAIGSPSDDDTAFASGAVYVYDLDGTNKVKIKASVPVSVEGYGDGALAVGAGKILVGAKSSPGSSSAEGAVYVYDLDGTNEVKLVDPNPASQNKFGEGVAIGSGRIVITGGPSRGNGTTGGIAFYIYDLNLNLLKSVEEPASLVGVNSGFARSYGKICSVGSGRIVIGAPLIGNVSVSGTGRGAAFIYDLEGNELKQIQAFGGSVYPPTADIPFSANFFGYSTAIDSGRIVIGAPHTNRRRSSDGSNISTAGAVYVYDLDGNPLSRLSSTSVPVSGDYFGESVAIRSGKIVVGKYAGSSSYSSEIYLYDTPNAITAYDVKSWEYGL